MLKQLIASCKRSRKIRTLAFWYPLLFIGICLLPACPVWGVRINRTASIPYKVFWSTRFFTLEKQIYVSLQHDMSVNLVKQIVGVPGDQISFHEGHIYINEQDYGSLRTQTSQGVPLTPVTSGVIPAGYVFVHGPHPDSFDSRYQQFGLIPIAHVEERLWPIF